LLLVSAALLCFPTGSPAQETPAEQATPPAPTTPPPPLPTVHAIEVSERGGQILSFRHLAGSTVVEMRGTEIEPRAEAKMKIESRRGFLEIDINRGEIKRLEPARRFGKDFLTYVLWAVSIDGEAINLGEITFEGGSPISINVTAPSQTFWLMVTAEPDFAVTDPSPVVVLYSINQDATSTSNKAQPVLGKLLYYTYYNDYDTSPASQVRGVPNELLQARKAVELAAKSGILAYPTPADEEPLPDELRTRETLEQARNFLRGGEEIFRLEGNTRDAVQFARTAAQIAENARALALGAVGGIKLRRLDRELGRARNELISAQDRLRQIEAALDQERQATAEADARAEGLRQQLAALEQSFEEAVRQAQRESSRLRAERDKVCAELRRQLNSLGQLTEQGGNMVLTLASDILFDFNRYELRPTARENLAKLTVLRQLLFPEAEVNYEGHTDLVGEEDYNQWLSEQRALAVFQYFLDQQIGLESDAMVRDASQQRLAGVQELLGMSFGASQRDSDRRNRLLVQLGGTVWGKGEREPVEMTEAPSERNRRVVLLIPPVEAGQATALCEAPTM
jgi:outer membrane protein OmpA-like peptidoglycan-associated protein